jgi:hypothetical protein
LAAEILGAALISDRELRRLFAEQAHAHRTDPVDARVTGPGTT